MDLLRHRIPFTEDLVVALMPQENNKVARNGMGYSSQKKQTSPEIGFHKSGFNAGDQAICL